MNTDASALKTIPLPAATVIDSALNVYQTALRKPSWAIWVVDYSGSMSGEGKNGVVKGLNTALDPDQAKKSYIEPASGDVNILIPFETEATARSRPLAQAPATCCMRPMPPMPAAAPISMKAC